MDEPLIVQVIRKYYADWEAPEDRGRTWMKCLCPFHGDGRASAGVSYEHESFRCLGCGFGGTAVSIIKQQEEVSYAEAKRIAAELSPGSDRAVSEKPARQPRRRVFGDEGAWVSEYQGGRGSLHAGVRGRATPWS